jgi:hypothetical protein
VQFSCSFDAGRVEAAGAGRSSTSPNLYERSYDVWFFPDSRGRRRRWPAHRTHRVLPATALSAAIAAASLAVSAPPASAVPGLQFIAAQTSTDSVPFKNLVIPCPAGTNGLGGDVTISGTTQARLIGVQPTSTYVYFAVTEPEEGVAGNWSFRAQAICAPSTSLPGLQYVLDSGAGEALARGNPVDVDVNARCPTGKGVIGMGGRVDGEFGTQLDLWTKVHMGAIRVNGAPGQAGANVHTVATAAGYDGLVLAQAIAVCVDRRQVPSLTWAEGEHSAFDSTADKQAGVTCPTGTTLQSGGFALNWQTADLTGNQIGVTGLQFTNTGVHVVGRERAVQTTKAWEVFAVAACA